MKKALQFLFIVFVFLLCAQILPKAQGLNDVNASQLPLVYAVGDNGAILKSTNTGINYAKVHEGGSELYSVCASGWNVWAAGDDGVLHMSTDKGVTWISQNISNGTALRAVYFTDSLTGFAAGANGLILKSVNGGNNWISLSPGTIFNLNKIKFINSSTGLVSGENNFIAKTTDGGMSWSPLTLPAASGSLTMDIYDNTILIGLDNSRLLISDNMGTNWDLIKLNIYTKPSVASVSLKSQVSFTAVLETGAIWNSTNRGVTFTYGVSPMLSQAVSSSFNQGRGFLVSGTHNAVLRSLDNGGNWQFPNGVSATISFQNVLPYLGSSVNKILDINYQKRGILYVCSGNTLSRTGNFGVNWQGISTLPTGTTCQQLLVSMKDSSKMIVAMRLNSIICNIFRTTNYGANWILTYQAPVDFTGNLLTQTPSNPDTVYMGVRDSVMRSTDFGLSWYKITGYPFEDWCDLAVNPANPNTLYAATNHYPAKLNKSTNGGYNWFMVDFVADTNFSEMPCIAISNLRPDIVFHAQFTSPQIQRGLKRSFNQGNSWLFTLFDGISWAVDIAKDDPNVVAHGSVSYTPVYISYNAGTNFIATPNQYSEQLFYYDRTNLYATNGSTIYRMRIVYEMSVIGITQISAEVPKNYMLSQNYPNPFNPVTNIKFDVPKSSNVKIIVYDVTGRLAAELINQNLQAGQYKTEWDAAGMSSGIYFYKMEASEYTETKKLILLK